MRSLDEKRSLDALTSPGAVSSADALTSPGAVSSPDAIRAAGAIEHRPSADQLSAAERTDRLAEPGFGQDFTDHMVTIRWSPADGWHEAVLSAYRPLVLDPACVGLHYAQSVFEGFQARRQGDGGVAVFRPQDHARRFQRSARRMAMPELPEELFLAAVDALVGQDRQWVPDRPGHSLYLRPLMFADETTIALRPATSYRFVLIASPTSGYGADGGAVRAWLAEDEVRAVKGGTGDIKCAANYGASLRAQARAAAQGCNQVLWIDAAERRWVEELGTMNVFFVQGEGPRARLVTPPLTGTVLPGITRDSLLRLARDAGYRVAEEPVGIEQWRSAGADGSFTEVFGCGSAA
ncbi:MAG: branched-chain amino acid aminotransferase, partial [Streptomyces sp.]|nr:branched-chain amino acid aminotransferase [Streptomyces sp.]